MCSIRHIRLYLVCASLLCGLNAQGQSFEEYRKKSQAQFNQYRQEQQEAVNSYRDKINREFSAMLGRPWKSFSHTPPHDNPLKDVPPPPIPSAPQSRQPGRDARYKAVTIKPAPQGQAADRLPPLEKETAVQTAALRFTFMGEPCTVHAGKRVAPASTAESDIARAWEAMSCPEYNLLAGDFQAIRSDLGLCDWAALQLAEETAFNVCRSRTSAEAVMLQMWLLSQAGMEAVMAVDESGRLRLLVATDKQLFDYPAFFVDDVVFYVADGAPVRTARVQACRFPGTRPLRMAFTRPATAHENPAQGKRSTVDGTRIRFYDGYPEFCDEGLPLSGFYYMAMVPLSRSAKEALYPSLKSRIAGKSATEAAGILLTYIQKEFPYREDEKVWNKERYFLAEETLCYDYSDCEDRAILYSWLVRDLLGLKTALVYYPGHLATAVRFGSSVDGDATFINGERYLICDPTYFGAGIGEEMPGVDKSKASVIPL